MDDTLEKQAFVIYDLKENKYRSSRSSRSYSKKFNKAILYTHRHVAEQASAGEKDMVVVSVNVKINLEELMMVSLKGKNNGTN